MQIHVLKAQGLSLREIARRLGVSRNTVARYLASQDVPRYKQREPRPTKLDPFQAYIVERMQAAAPDAIAAPALLRELRSLGYEGQLRSIQAFMKAHKPAPASDPIVRFETEPGRQMQCDFVVFRRGANPLYAFTATLGFSRWRWARFAANEKAQTLIACHHALFDTLGGVPREILYDNAKTIVLERDAYGKGEHRWHPGLLDLAKRYGFMPTGSANLIAHARRARSSASIAIYAATSTCRCPAGSSSPACCSTSILPTPKSASGYATLPTNGCIRLRERRRQSCSKNASGIRCASCPRLQRHCQWQRRRQARRHLHRYRCSIRYRSISNC